MTMSAEDLLTRIKKLEAVTVERGASKSEAAFASETVRALERKYKRQLSARARADALEEADQAAQKIIRNLDLRSLRKAMRDIKKSIDHYDKTRLFQDRLRRLIDEATKRAESMTKYEEPNRSHHKAGSDHVGQGGNNG